MRHHKTLALASLLVISIGAAVQATAASQRHNVLMCEASTREGVIACCEKTAAGRLPIWMERTRTTCRTQAFCAPRAGKMVCRIAPAQDFVDIDTLNVD